MVQEHACDESWLRTFEVSVGGLSLVMPENFLSAAGGKKVSTEKAKNQYYDCFQATRLFCKKKQAPQVFIYNPLPSYLQKSHAPLSLFYTIEQVCKSSACFSPHR